MSALEEEPAKLPLSPDEILEINIDDITDKRFGVFGPNEAPEPRLTKIRKLAAQSAVRVTHALDAIVVGPSVYVSEIERERRNKERQAVGLKPKK